MEVPEIPPSNTDAPTAYAKRLKATSKQLGKAQIHQQWKSKKLHGKYPLRLHEADVDQLNTNQWLRSDGLKAETEGLIIAAQDQTLPTRWYQHNIIKAGTDPLCKVCGQYDETIDHILSGCPELAKAEYIYRHNKVAKYIHWKICKFYNIETNEKWYEHQPCIVTEGKEVTILWDMPILTDKEIAANRPDIVVKDRKKKQCMLLDVSIPSDRNTSVKMAEKLSKYKDLEIEIRKMWQLKTIIVPIVIGALGLIKKDLKRYLSEIPAGINITEIQKISLLESAHILRKILSIV